jgi:hypothetical protein
MSYTARYQPNSGTRGCQHGRRGLRKRGSPSKRRGRRSSSAGECSIGRAQRSRRPRPAAQRLRGTRYRAHARHWLGLPARVPPPPRSAFPREGRASLGRAHFRHHTGLRGCPNKEGVKRALAPVTPSNSKNTQTGGCAEYRDLLLCGGCGGDVSGSGVASDNGAGCSRVAACGSCLSG